MANPSARYALSTTALPEAASAGDCPLLRTCFQAAGLVNKETAVGQHMSELLEACQRGNVKQVESALRRYGLKQDEKEQALRIAAEYAQAAAFEAVLLTCPKPGEETVLHASKWALRYHNRRLLGLVMQADGGRWILPHEHLEELRTLETREAKPDQVVLYLIERLFAFEKTCR